MSAPNDPMIRTRPARPKPATDELLVRARAGDRDAFDRLAVRAIPRLMGTCHRLLPASQDAEEAVADALYRAFCRLPRFRMDCAFETWVHRILCRVVVDRWRSRMRRARLMERAGRREAAREAAGPLQAAAGREEGERVRDAVRALPTLQRLVVILHAWEGLALHEVARVLDAPYATVKSNLHHARAALRARFRGSAP
jgi:RNA polymerase sigma-70 factor (ECF subfamily)